MPEIQARHGVCLPACLPVTGIVHDFSAWPAMFLLFFNKVIIIYHKNNHLKIYLRMTALPISPKNRTKVFRYGNIFPKIEHNCSVMEKYF